MGVMDEVERRSLPEVDSSTSTKDGTPATSNAKITDFFKPNLPTVQKPTHGYYLVDSKTRRIPTLPKKEYTTAVSCDRDTQFSRANKADCRRSHVIN